MELKTNIPKFITLALLSGARAMRSGMGYPRTPLRSEGNAVWNGLVPSHSSPERGQRGLEWVTLALLSGARAARSGMGYPRTPLRSEGSAVWNGLPSHSSPERGQCGLEWVTLALLSGARAMRSGMGYPRTPLWSEGNAVWNGLLSHSSLERGQCGLEWVRKIGLVLMPPSQRMRGATAVLVRHKPQWHRHDRRSSAVVPLLIAVAPPKTVKTADLRGGTQYSPSSQ